jgi:hypothetical protein
MPLRSSVRAASTAIPEHIPLFWVATEVPSKNIEFIAVAAAFQFGGSLNSAPLKKQEDDL